MASLARPPQSQLRELSPELPHDVEAPGPPLSEVSPSVRQSLVTENSFRVLTEPKHFVQGIE
jgi:hypothetical protein